MARVKRRGPQSPVDWVDSWRWMGCGRFHFSMLPQQLPRLTKRLPPASDPSLTSPRLALDPLSSYRERLKIYRTSLPMAFGKAKSAAQAASSSSSPALALDTSSITERKHFAAASR